MDEVREINSKGDTLLILRDPNRPFKEVGRDDLWDNHLQMYDDFNIYKSHLLDNKKEYDSQDARVGHPSPKNTDKDVRWQVSSKRLKSASAYFRNLAAEDWNEGKMSEKGYKHTITVQGWSTRALHQLLLRIHGNNEGLCELQADPKLCGQLAVIVDAYQCHNLFRLRFPVVLGRFPYNENLLYSFFSSWVFGDENNFKAFSLAIILQVRGRMHTLDMPIPESIIDAIEQSRQYYIAGMVNVARDTALVCDQVAGEDIKESLSVIFGSWPPIVPFDGLSVGNVYKALRDTQILDGLECHDFYLQTDFFSERGRSKSSIYLLTLDRLRDCWEGLDMKDFPISI